MHNRRSSETSEQATLEAVGSTEQLQNTIKNLERKLENRSTKSRHVYEELQAEHNKLKSAHEKESNDLKARIARLEETQQPAANDVRLQEHEKRIAGLQETLDKCSSRKDRKIAEISSGLATCKGQLSTLTERVNQLDEKCSGVPPFAAIEALIDTRIQPFQERLTSSNQALQAIFDGHVKDTEQQHRSTNEHVEKLETRLTTIEVSNTRSEVNEKITSMASRARAVEEAISACDAKLETQSRQITDLGKHATKFDTVNADFKGQINGINDQLSATNHAAKLLKVAIGLELRQDGASANEATLVTQLNELVKKANAQDGLILGVTEQLDELTSRSQESRIPPDLQQTIENLSYRLMELEQRPENDKVVNKLFETSREHGNRLKTLETKRDVVAQLSTVIDDCKDMQDLQNRMHAVEQKAEEIPPVEKIIHFAEEVARFNERLANVQKDQSKMDLLQSDKERLEERVSVLQTESKNAQEKIRQIDEVSEDIEHFERRMKKLEDKLTHTEQSRSSEDDQSTTTKVIELNRTLSSQLDSVKESMAKMQAEIDELHARAAEQHQQQQEERRVPVSLSDEIARIRERLQGGVHSPDVSLEMGRLIEAFSKTTPSSGDLHMTPRVVNTAHAFPKGNAGSFDHQSSAAVVQPRTPSSDVHPPASQETDEDQQPNSHPGEIMDDGANALNSDDTRFALFRIRDGIQKMLASNEGAQQAELLEEHDDQEEAIEIDEGYAQEEPRRSGRKSGKRDFKALGLMTWPEIREEKRAMKKARVS